MAGGVALDGADCPVVESRLEREGVPELPRPLYLDDPIVVGAQVRAVAVVAHQQIAPAVDVAAEFPQLRLVNGGNALQHGTEGPGHGLVAEVGLDRQGIGIVRGYPGVFVLDAASVAHLLVAADLVHRLATGRVVLAPDPERVSQHLVGQRRAEPGPAVDPLAGGGAVEQCAQPNLRPLKRQR